MRSKIAIVLCSLLAIPFAISAQEAERPDLSGAWSINASQSETLREKMREMMTQDIANPRTRARWDRIQTRDRMHMESAPFARLEIDHAEPLLKIRYGGGRLRELFTDGRQLEPDPEYGVEAVAVVWQGARLTIDSETSRGRATEFWELSDDGMRLFVTTQMEMGERFSGSVAFQRVYDRQPPEEVAPADEESEEPEESEPEG